MATWVLSLMPLGTQPLTVAMDASNVGQRFTVLSVAMLCVVTVGAQTAPSQASASNLAAPTLRSRSLFTLSIRQISPKLPSPLSFLSPKQGEGKGFHAPLLPFWEKGLGDEGKGALVRVLQTFA
jgi:hypothetical protein